MRKFAFLAIGIALAGLGYGQQIDPFYSGSYSYLDLGSVPGVPINYGGLALKRGDQGKLLLGGAANGPAGEIFEIDVVRDANGHIIGFSGTATVFAAAPYNDGGIVYGPGGVLFASRYPVNQLAQYKPGSIAPDKIIDMTALGIAGSHATLQFAPNGKVKLGSWSGGQFYDANVVPDGLGTYDLANVVLITTLVGGPEGYAYVPEGSPLFSAPSMLVSEYSNSMVTTYEVDSNFDPIDGTRREFMTGLSGAEGAFIDPVTGDFLFSTFGGFNRIVRVSGFEPPFFKTSPTSYTIIEGIPFGGNLASLGSSDDDSLFILNDENEPNTKVNFKSSGAIDDRTMELIVETSATREDLSQFLYAYNYDTSALVLVNVQSSNLTDVVTTVPLGPAYISNFGDVEAELVWIPQQDIETSDGWAESVDSVRWKSD